jgi:hypothetical protein
MASRRAFLRSALVFTPLLAIDPQLVFRPDKQSEKDIKAFVKALRKSMRAMFREAETDVAGWGLSTPLYAAGVTTDTTVIAQSVRQPGQYVSGTFAIPASITFVRLFANIGLADKLSTGLFCDLMLQSATDGVTFQDREGFGWGSYGPDGYHVIGKDGTPIDNPDPSLGHHVVPGDDTALFRLVLTLPQALTLGATVSVTTG